MTYCRGLFLALVAALGLVGCGSDSDSSPAPSQDAGADTLPQDPDGATPEADTQDSSAGQDSSLADSSAEDSSPQDGASDSALSDASPESGTGFSIRTPQKHMLTCSGGYPGDPNDPQEFSDMDWICFVEYNGTQGLVYIQSTPTACQTMLAPIPTTYESPVAQISINGVISSVQNASYSFGGNHHNDSLSFDYQGTHYELNHSSFGFGWRACQNMDCLRVGPAGSSSVTEDGCTAERTLPIVCSQIKDDGTYDALVDTFAPCPGDPNHQDGG